MNQLKTYRYLPDGTTVRITTTVMHGRGLHESIDFVVHYRKSEDSEWELDTEGKYPVPAPKQLQLGAHIRELIKQGSFVVTPDLLYSLDINSPAVIICPEGKAAYWNHVIDTHLPHRKGEITVLSPSKWFRYGSEYSCKFFVVDELPSVYHAKMKMSMAKRIEDGSRVVLLTPSMIGSSYNEFLKGELGNDSKSYAN